MINEAARRVKATIQVHHLAYAKRELQGQAAKRLRLSPSSDVESTAFEPLTSSCEVYDQAVSIYRKLRNDIPFLTDAAYDIDAASESAKIKNLKDLGIEQGPLVKKAPPGRGRKKRMSVVNTPLPAEAHKELQKQSKRAASAVDPLRTVRYETIKLQRPLGILYVDDSLESLKLTAHRLREYGMMVDYTTSAIDAINRLKSPTAPVYDIFLIDLNLPNHTAHAVTRLLRRKEEEKRKFTGVISRQFIVGTSTDTDPATSNSALAAGMDVFLGKPFTPSDILLFISVASASTGSDSTMSSGDCEEGEEADGKEEETV
jgi:CheY-like chemotaxis protein